ncbi:MAG TPA: hypothetical protein VGO79_14040 [Thermoanaerobaculia bacterium]
MRYWFVAASDRRGARRGFLVPTDRRPTEANVVKAMQGRARVVELSGQSVDVKSLDLLTVRVVGDDARLAPIKNDKRRRHTIEGDPIVVSSRGHSART